MFANGVEWGDFGWNFGWAEGSGGELCWIFASREHIEGEMVDKRTVFCPKGCVLKKKSFSFESFCVLNFVIRAKVLTFMRCF